jgi:unsaturated rhamnogalacturonyl hydrolase
LGSGSSPESAVTNVSGSLAAFARSAAARISGEGSDNRSSKKSETLLSDGNTPIMALVRHGAGLVVALGDPWIYNEYINSKDNHRMAESLFRFLLKR